MRPRVELSVRRIRALAGKLRPWAADLSVALATIAGWLLITAGIAALSVPEVWPISIGLLLLAGAGCRTIGIVVYHGLYKLMRGQQ